MSYLKYIKNVGLVLVILGHYYFCSYVLSEVHDMKNYEPRVNVTIQGDDKSDKKSEAKQTETLKSEALKVTNDEKLGVIEIPKINLKRYLYKVDAYQNNVDKNIEVLKSSDMPDVKEGNLILAGHNGNTSVGHFRNLHNLSLADDIIVNYKGKSYNYEVSKIYDVLKTGTVAIKRDKNKNTITLITCLGSDRQLVVIGYLK
ncbi:putative uncharacterized protein [Firmicutes bacterium CAG:822]|nr:putative uncharacterized protein [Firmicutes bacterium CAG:822]